MGADDVGSDHPAPRIHNRWRYPENNADGKTTHRGEYGERAGERMEPEMNTDLSAEALPPPQAMAAEGEGG